MPERTPLYQEHLRAGGRMVDFAGWEMPQQYSSVQAEHQAVRTAAGLFDISHMGRVVVSGPAAFDHLQGLVTNDLGRVEVGHAQYNLLCREDGGIVDDIVVYRRAPEVFTVVVNASNREKDLAWFQRGAPAGVEIEDRSRLVSLLALQGPRAEAVAATVAEGVDLASIPYFGFANGRLAGIDVNLSRTGYTGEDGFELFVASEQAPSLWSALLEAGRPHGVLPAGLAARDVCRLEAGLRLYGNDMDESVNPYQAGLGWTVKLGKGEFSGRAALEAVKAAGPDRVIAGLLASERTIPRHGGAVKVGGRQVGEVTSGTFSFWLKTGIGMASILREAAVPGTPVELDGRGAPGAAEVVALPFYRGSVKPAAATTS